MPTCTVTAFRHSFIDVFVFKDFDCSLIIKCVEELLPKAALKTFSKLTEITLAIESFFLVEWKSKKGSIVGILL